MLLQLIEVIRERGFFKGIKYAFEKLTGKAQIKDNIDTLFYLFNRYADIGKFPKAEGNLRKLQLCDTELLKVFDAVCKKHEFTYWIDWGTLLGAVRHKGFIPWDDDMDVTMPREDFDKAMEVLPEEMKKYGIVVSEFKDWPYAVFGFSYRHEETGIWLDVFPADFYYAENDSQEEKNKLKALLEKYRKYYLKRRLKDNKESVLGEKDRLLSEYTKSPERTKGYMTDDLEFEPNVFLQDMDNVFPLSTTEFEEFTVPVPNNLDKYLRVQYGDTYMQFPRSGIEHHGSDKNKLSDWAEVHGVDMDEVIQELKSIEAAIKE